MLLLEMINDVTSGVAAMAMLGMVSNALVKGGQYMSFTIL